MALSIINWLEIPVTDMARARRFYESILDVSIVDLDVGGEFYPCFPDKSGEGFTGALVQYEFLDPGRSGPLVYLDASPSIADAIARIRRAGGKIIRDRTEIAPGFGYYALFEDSEGNLLALQAAD